MEGVACEKNSPHDRLAATFDASRVVVEVINRACLWVTHTYHPIPPRTLHFVDRREHLRLPRRLGWNRTRRPGIKSSSVTLFSPTMSSTTTSQASSSRTPVQQQPIGHIRGLSKSHTERCELMCSSSFTALRLTSVTFTLGKLDAGMVSAARQAWLPLTTGHPAGPECAFARIPIPPPADPVRQPATPWTRLHPHYHRRA